MCYITKNNIGSTQKMSVEPWEMSLEEREDFMKRTTSPILHYGPIAQLVERVAVNHRLS